LELNPIEFDNETFLSMQQEACPRMRHLMLRG